ncbi:hypothetical protein ACJ72_04862 [Emergomyces africanus]|uniref:Uncharacterized protein n=1 Tax=Emergomyces africanus TaxID=1955775 RepID=A0A1B7NVI5_9EURO|nr:hypothetical protein ACJ72_04862 [Emergomyces africanus]
MEPNKIYVILSVSPVEYHWEIYVSDDVAQSGVIHHANNATGGWSYERKHTDTTVRSQMLALALKVGTVPVPLPDGRAQIDQILGDPAMISQAPEFRCRAWALDGVARLHKMGIVDAPDTSVVMAKSYELADANRTNIELGLGKCTVASL